MIARPLIIKCGRQFLKFKQIRSSIYAEFALMFLNLRWNLKIIFLLRGNSSLWNDKLYFFKSTFKNLFQNSVIFYLIWEFTFVLQIKRLLYCKKNQWSFFRSEYNLPQRSKKKNYRHQTKGRSGRCELRFWALKYNTW